MLNDFQRIAGFGSQDFLPGRLVLMLVMLVLVLVLVLLLMLLLLLLLPLDDHLLQLGLLQHVRQLVMVIKVNHGMLQNKFKIDILK